MSSARAKSWHYLSAVKYRELNTVPKECSTYDSGDEDSWDKPGFMHYVRFLNCNHIQHQNSNQVQPNKDAFKHLTPLDQNVQIFQVPNNHLGP